MSRMRAFFPHRGRLRLDLRDPLVASAAQQITDLVLCGGIPKTAHTELYSDIIIGKRLPKITRLIKRIEAEPNILDSSRNFSAIGLAGQLDNTSLHFIILDSTPTDSHRKQERQRHPPRKAVSRSSRLRRGPRIANCRQFSAPSSQVSRGRPLQGRGA